MDNYFHLLAEKVDLFFSNLNNRKVFFIITILGLILFSNSLLNKFLIDDFTQITESPTVQSIKNINSFFTGSTFYSEGSLAGVYYKPILTTSFSILYSLFGPNYSAFHLFQILLHIICTFILFLFLSKFFRKPLALVLSLVFLVHPINSEAVFYISNLQEPLFFFFGISALYILTLPNPKLPVYIPPVLLIFSLLSKETGILFVAMCLLYTFFYKRKIFLSNFYSSLLILAIYYFMRVGAIGNIAKPLNSPIDRLNLANRIINVPAIFFNYLKLFIFPFNLSSSYQWVYTQIDFNKFFLPLILDLLFISIISLFAIRLYKRHSLKTLTVYTFFGVWFFIGLLLHLQIFPLDATLAERWFYFPIVGLLGIAGVLIDVYGVSFRNKWVIFVVVVLLSVLSIRTFVRSFDWRDEFTLAIHDIQVSKDDYNLEELLSAGFFQQRKIEVAKTHIERSIVLFPFYINYYDLGTIYFYSNDFEKAKAAYLKSLEYYPNYYPDYQYLGQITLVAGEINNNIDFLKTSVQKFPRDGKLWLYLAILEYKNGDTEKAKKSITNSYVLDQNPETSNIYYIITNNKILDLKVQMAK